MAGQAGRPAGRLKNSGLLVGILVTLIALQVVLTPTAHASPSCDDIDPVTGECRDDETPDRPDDPPDKPAPKPEEGDTYTETTYTSACTSEPPPGSDYDCMANHSCPTEGELRYNVWTRTVTYTGDTWVPDKDWENQGPQCLDLSPEEPVVTEDDVRREVVRFGLPGTKLALNPPDGVTLINFDTNFYTEASPVDLELQVLDQPVRIHATPKRYVWSFGDGTPARSTHSPGRPYPDLDVTHSYDRLGTFTARVQIRYQVQWDAGDGSQTIDEYITGELGPGTRISTRENRGKLSDEDAGHR